MREILFRGKRLDTGEWTVGSLWMDVDTPRILSPGNIAARAVDPATVGQYTGLTDKNGKRIFEGDLLTYFDDEIQVVEWFPAVSNIWLHTYGTIEVKRGRKRVQEPFEGWSGLDDYPLDEMEVIGNIHDNPELLAKEAE